MKILSQLFVIVVLISLIISCNNSNKDSVRDDARSTLRDLPPGSVTPPAANPNAMSTSGTVPHYICPNNCQGSGGAAAGTCPVCGSEYTHNQAYHNQASTSNPSINLGDQTPTISTTPEPAQNAAGVWHYTCTAGCAGGAGTAGKCATCGGDLAHNTAYHN